MTGKTFAAALAAAALLAAVPAAAQTEYKTSGFVIGAALTGTGVTVEDGDEADSGAGISVRVGYGFGPRFSLYMAGSGASMEEGDYSIGHFDLGARYLFSVARLRPYLEGGISGRAVNIPLAGLDVDARGAGITLGGGIEYSFGRTAALDLGLDYTFGEYNEGRVNGGSWEDLGDDAFSSTSARLNIGVVWRP